MPEVEFLLAGDGPLRQELEQEGADARVERRSRVSWRSPRYSGSARFDGCGVLTSDSESLSNVILEAMAAGLPVVAYQSGGNPELINEQRGSLQRPE